jgi:hypothetical protein
MIDAVPCSRCQSHRKEERDASHQPSVRTLRHQNHEATLYVSLELSHATWLVTSLSPGSEKMSKHSLVGGDGKALF